MKKLILSAFVVWAFATPSFAADEAPADKAAIEALIATFSEAIRTKDEEALSALFVSPETPFVLPAVYLPDGRRHSPEGGVQIKNAQKFVSDVVETDDHTEERLYEISIVISEDLATMTARYDFLRNGDVANSGYEVWSLAKLGETWQIVSVIWTGHLPSDR